MSDYYQCGVFRVHAPTHILKEEVMERRQMREAKINAITNLAKKICKCKDESGKYINGNIAIPVTEDKALYIYFENGQYDIFLYNAEKDEEGIDITPSEIDAIINKFADIMDRMTYELKSAERGVFISYASPRTVAAYHKKGSPDVNPIRGRPYSKNKYDDFERE